MQPFTAIRVISAVVFALLLASAISQVAHGTLANCATTHAAHAAHAGGGGIIHVPSKEAPTIQAAIKLAEDGDEIIVGPGTYNEKIAFFGQAITLRSSHGPEATIIQGPGNGSVVTVWFGEGPETIIDGFTITGGSGTTTTGGGMTITQQSSPTVINCIFKNNVSPFGGAIYIFGGSPVIIDCIFEGNIATSHIGAGFGGAIHVGTGGHPTITNSLFISNTAGTRGGAVNLSPAIGGSVTVINSTFIENTTSLGGGGISGSQVTVSGCVFIKNHSNSNGGAIGQASSSTTIAHSVFCANTWEHISGSWINLGGNVFDLFGDLNCDGAVSQDDVDVLLSMWGECPEPPEDCPSDLNGDGVVDDLDLEILLAEVWITDGTIQAAIDAATDGEEVVIGPGVYNETIDFKGKAIHLRSERGPETTIIDATGLGGSVVTCASGEGLKTIIEGFTVRGGDGILIGNIRYGGGMYNLKSSPTVMGCILRGNSAHQGAGMYNEQSHPTVTDCVFTENVGIYAGMSNRESSPTVTNCVFVANVGDGMRNTAQSDPVVTDCQFLNNQGRGMFTSNQSSPHVMNCTFVGNTNTGMVNFSSSSQPVVTNCLFEGNWSHEGGAMLNSFCSPFVSNCVFRQNQAETGGAIYNHNNEATIIDCTFESNVSARGGAIFNNLSSPTIEGCTFDSNVAVGMSFGTANRGGAILNQGSSPTVVDSIFLNNTAGVVSSFSGTGGAIYSDALSGVESDVTLINCLFEGNFAAHGGSMYTASSKATILDCEFISNSANPMLANSLGGAISNFSSEVLIEESLFSNNVAAHGGAVFNQSTTASIADSTFTENVSTWQSGGAIRNTTGSSTAIARCVFSSNEAWLGGAISNGGGGGAELDVVDCEFDTNSANGYGGGIANLVDGVAVISGSIFTRNTAGTYGGALANACTTAGSNCGHAVITKCDFIGNHAANDGGAIAHLSQSSSVIADAHFCYNPPNHIMGDWVNGGGNDLCIPGDLNEDGAVLGTDLIMLLSLWGACPAPYSPITCPADLNGDGVVNGFDLLLLLGNWGTGS